METETLTKGLSMLSRQNIETYFHQELATFDALNLTDEERAGLNSRLPVWRIRLHRIFDILHASDLDIPTSFLKPYPCNKAAFRAMGTQVKYQFRGLNILREVSRISLLAPELLSAGQTLQVLELSSGPCGLYEALGHFGHQVQVTDEMEISGKHYAPIHDSLSLSPLHCDGRQLPYDFALPPFNKSRPPRVLEFPLGL